MALDSTDILKLVSAVLIFALSITFGILPYKVKAFRENLNVMDLANAFAGGLFLALGLSHILPEAVEEFEDYYEDIGKDYEDQFPWAYVCVLASYLLILLLEKVFLKKYHVHPGPNQAHAHLGEEDKQDPDETDKLVEASDSTEQRHWEDLEVKHHHHHEKKEAGQFSKDTGIILMVGLSFHGLFEGLALGLQTTFTSTLSLFIGIFVHKWAESLALGIAFLQSGTPVVRAATMMVVFCSMTPIGVILGLIISGYNPIFSGVFNALAVGTFLYIATEELIHETFEVDRNTVLKYSFIFLGVLFVMLINLIEMYTE